MSTPPAQRRYHIETWGCQMNVHDSEKLSGALECEGYIRATDLTDADVILLNTCSIREKAAEKVFSELGRLRRLKRKRPGLLIGVCGCVAQQEGEQIFARAPYVDFVIGPRATGSLPKILANLRNGESEPQLDTAYREDSIRFPFDAIRRQGLESGKAFVTVIEGCNHRCTYCIVPTTRGREICRPMEQVLAEVRQLAAQGVLEIEFLGQTVNAYRDAAGHTLADLLTATTQVDGVERIRFTTSHPAQMTDRLMDAMAAGAPKVCPYLHLPVQSGSSKVLRDMRRGYDRERYLKKIEGLRRRMPGMLFGTDVIVGFPTEDEVDFQQTLTLLDEVEYDTVYSFAYSTRPGTQALQLGDPLAEQIKLERLQRLQLQQRETQRRRQQRWVGQDVEILVEGPSKKSNEMWSGRTAENRIVHFERSAISSSVEPGQLLALEVVEATPYSLQGRAVSHPIDRLAAP